MLESALKEQLKGIFAGLEANFTFDISVSSSHENKTELLELLGDVADCSDHITCSVNEGEALKFTLLKNSDRTGITFRGIPNGHEFTSLLLAILNLDGKGKNFRLQPCESTERPDTSDHLCFVDLYELP